MGSLDYKRAENAVFRAEHAESAEQKKVFYQRAVRLYKRAAEFFVSSRRKDKEALCYLKAARAARKSGDSQEAMDDFGKAAQMFEDEAGDKMEYTREERASFLRSASGAYSRMHDIDPGQEGLEDRSKELSERANSLEKAAKAAEERMAGSRKTRRAFK